MIRRTVTALLLAAVAAAGAGTAALARKAPPHHKPHSAKRHHKPRPHRRKPARKPAHRPATATTPTTPAATVPTQTTPAAPTTPTTTQTTATTPATVPTPPPVLAHSLGVSAADAPGGGFVLSLSRTVLGAGSEVVEFVNRSQDGHDLRIDAADGTQQAAWDELASLAAPVDKTVVLSPGTYRVYCTLHPGMEKQLTVSAG